MEVDIREGFVVVVGKVDGVRVGLNDGEEVGLVEGVMVEEGLKDGVVVDRFNSRGRFGSWGAGRSRLRLSNGMIVVGREVGGWVKGGLNGGQWASL